MNRSKAARAKRRAEAEWRNAIVAYESNGYTWRPINRARAQHIEFLANWKLIGVQRVG